jgi:hypothetical protein
MSKMTTLTVAIDRDVRRRASRRDDIIKLRRSVWVAGHKVLGVPFRLVGVQPFDWGQRYSSEYLIQWARDAGWRPSRLTKAVDAVDKVLRIRANAAVRKREDARRRGLAAARKIREGEE